MGFLKKLINVKILTSRKRRLNHSILLFSLNFTLVFVIGLVPDSNWLVEMYNFVVSGIFFAAVISISDKHIRFLIFAVLLTILTWLSSYLALNFILHITSLVTIAFFAYIIVISVIRISRSKEVGPLEFLRSVNIYFLIGIVGAIVFRSIYTMNPDALNISDKDVLATTDLVYFSFQTITTLGYGDISPISPLAKNVSIFLAFAGQMYLTFIIAIIIGKYLRTESNPETGSKNT